MADKAAGAGAAHNATVSTADLEEALREARARDEAAGPGLRVTNARDKLARAERDREQAAVELKAALAAEKDA